MPTERKRKREYVAKGTGVKQYTPDQNIGEGSSQGDGVEEVLRASEEQDDASSFSLERDDEEPWEGLGARGVMSQRGGTLPKKPPTGEELRTIKDAADLYMSGSFKLKIDALLPKVRPKYTRFASLEKFLLSLHSFLSTLPSSPLQHPLSASRDMLKRGVYVPYPSPQPKDDTKWKVSFEKPQDVNIVGSWITQLAVKRKDGLPYVIDLAVEMPDSLFQEKDYLNNRFFHKRAYYLSAIAAALLPPPNETRPVKVRGKGRDTEKSDVPALNVELSWETLRGDPRLSALVLTHKSDGSVYDFSSLNVQVRIIPTLSTTSPIPLNRLSPRRSNVRTGSTSTSTDELRSSESGSTTPIYNSRLLMNTTTRSHLLRMYNLQKTTPAFADALALLKVWANQRGYGESDGRAHRESPVTSEFELKWSVRGFDGMGAWWVAVLDYLVNGGQISGAKREKRRPLGHSLSSYQLFRAALDFLSRQRWPQDRIFLKAQPLDIRFPEHEYESNDTEAVFVDLHSGMNFLAGVPMTSLEMLQYDAKVTLGTLSNKRPDTVIGDPFEEVFLTDKRSLQARFDIVIRVDLSEARLPQPSAHSIVEQGSPYNTLVATMLSTLRAGLGNRVKALVVLHPIACTSDIGDYHPDNAPVVHIGVILDSEYAYRLVDFGPPAAAEDNDAHDQHAEERKRFRALWGPKADLRRFKDGRILESVVWEVHTADERAHIPFRICEYLLKRHCGIGSDASDAISWSGGKWDELLKPHKSIVHLYQAAKVELGYKSAMSAFDTLVKALKSLDDELPLAILNVSPVSSLLRYTSVFSPIAVPPTSPLLASSSSATLPMCARYLPAMDIVIEFEKSGRWPDDLRAIQKVKMAFLETIAVCLGNRVAGLHAQVVLEGDEPEGIHDSVRLDILTPAGWAFSARICHDREATLLDHLINENSHLSKAVKRHLERNAAPEEIKTKYDAIRAKNLHLRRYVHSPTHHRAIAALSHRYSAYAGTVRLVKRWLAAHWLLSGHLQEEAVELICSAAFLSATGALTAEDENGVSSIPGTKERGFSLVVQFLAHWEWENGLSVHLYGDNGDGDSLPSAPDNITGRRTAWVIKTERDPDGRVWTSDGPDAIVARRITDVARATWHALQASQGSQYDIKELFVHPTTHYDVLIKLEASRAPRYFQHLTADETVWLPKGRYANATNPPVDNIPLLIEFDPVQMLFTDLQMIYEDTFKLFYDPHGGTTFGVIFDPILKDPRPLRVRSDYNSIPKTTGERTGKDKDKALVTFNLEAILREIERMGSGLLSQVVVQDRPS